MKSIEYIFWFKLSTCHAEILTLPFKADQEHYPISRSVNNNKATRAILYYFIIEYLVNTTNILLHIMMDLYLMLIWIILVWSGFHGRIASCMYIPNLLHQPNTDFNILIAGGNYYNDTWFSELADVEFVNPLLEKSVCENPIDLPHKLDGPVRGIIDEKPVICGGLKTRISDENGFEQTIESGCYQGSNDEWSSYHSLKCPRWGASSLMLDQDTMWTFGGNTNTESSDECKDVAKSSEVYKPYSGKFELGVTLPEPMVYSCSVKIDENRVFIVNGYDQNYDGFSRSYIVDTSKKPFSFHQLPHLEKVRSQAACGIISYHSAQKSENDVAIIVAGGGYGNSSKTTEIYKLSNDLHEGGTWETGPSLPRGFSNGCHVSSHVNDLLLIGGFDESGDVRSDIITYNKESEEFELSSVQLKTPRYGCTAIKIPNTGECVKT